MRRLLVVDDTNKELLEKIEKLTKQAEKVQPLEDKEFRAIVPQHSIGRKKEHSARILLAEDNPVHQKQAKMMLTKAGYHVEVADNGQEAVEKYTNAPEKFDLIFMDVQMPGTNGIKATKAIRQDGFDQIPIVALTAHAMKGDKETCIEAGMDDYITKPIKKEPLFEMIEKWVFGKEVA